MESSTFLTAKSDGKYGWWLLLSRRSVNVAWLLKAFLFFVACVAITLFWSSTLRPAVPHYVASRLVADGGATQLPPIEAAITKSPAIPPTPPLLPPLPPTEPTTTTTPPPPPPPTTTTAPTTTTTTTTTTTKAPTTTTTTTVTPKPTPTTTPVDKFAVFRTKPPMPQGRDCYTRDHIDHERIELFEDVQTTDGRRPTNGTNIFFHETACHNGIVALNVRQACAVESAARANPNTNIFLMYASPVGFERNQPRPVLFEALANYRNVHLRNLDLWRYTEQTPAAEWMRNGSLFKSSYLTVHTSDMLRLVSCYKWGGSHMDLDFVVRKSFEAVPPNYAAEETDGFIANGLINFEEKNLGHLIVGHLVQEFVDNYNGAIFAANGPALLKRVFHELCQVQDLKKCQLLHIFPKTTFYAVYGTVWERLFQGKYGKESMAAVKDSMAVHMWNAITAWQKIKLGEGSAYELLAREFCPRVFATIEGDEF